MPEYPEIFANGSVSAAFLFRSSGPIKLKNSYL